MPCHVMPLPLRLGARECSRSPEIGRPGTAGRLGPCSVVVRSSLFLHPRLQFPLQPVSEARTAEKNLSRVRAPLGRNPAPARRLRGAPACLYVGVNVTHRNPPLPKTTPGGTAPVMKEVTCNPFKDLQGAKVVVVATPCPTHPELVIARGFALSLGRLFLFSHIQSTSGLGWCPREEIFSGLGGKREGLFPMHALQVRAYVERQHACRSELEADGARSALDRASWPWQLSPTYWRCGP